MKRFGEWKKVESICTNCGATLDSRPVFGGSHLHIKGCEPMEFRHSTNGCKKPEIHSCWGKYEEWLRTE